MSNWDNELSDRLRAQAAPGHGEGFFEELQRTLETAAAVEEAQPAHRGAGRGAWTWRRWAFASAAAACLAVFSALILFGVPGFHGTVPPEANAYTRTRDALIRARSIHALEITTVTVSNADHRHWVNRSTVVLNSKGDWRSLSWRVTDGGQTIGAPGFETYDVATRTIRYWGWGGTAAGVASWRRGEPPCDLAAQPGQDALPFEPVASDRRFALDALAKSNAQPQSVTALGRPAWRVELMGLKLRNDFDGTHITRMVYVIDKGSGIVLQWADYDSTGRLYQSKTVARLTINPKLRSGQPVTAFPAAAHFKAPPDGTNVSWTGTPSRPAMSVQGQGAVDLPLAALAHRGGGGKLYVAGWLPSGFRLQQSTYGDGIQLLYQAGLDYVQIQIQWAKNTFDHPTGSSDKVELGSGVFAGRDAYLDGQTSAQVTARGVQVTVQGILSRDEMLRILGSLHRFT